MANHVNSQLYFERINDKAKEKLAMILKWNELKQNNQRLDNFHDIMEHAPENPDYSWYHDNVGPKWCSFEEYDLDHIHCTSAWGWPLEGYGWLVNELRKEDPYLLARVTYEDEMPNFYGVAGWGPSGFEDYYFDLEEGIDTWKKLSKTFDFIIPFCDKNEEDEYPEEFHENKWEAIYEHQSAMWEMDLSGDIELWDDDGNQVEYHENGTPKQDVKPTWQDQ